jgi:hypothetical protein
MRLLYTAQQITNIEQKNYEKNDYNFKIIISFIISCFLLFITFILYHANDKKTQFKKQNIINVKSVGRISDKSLDTVDDRSINTEDNTNNNDIYSSSIDNSFYTNMINNISSIFNTKLELQDNSLTLSQWISYYIAINQDISDLGGQLFILNPENERTLVTKIRHTFQREINKLYVQLDLPFENDIRFLNKMFILKEIIQQITANNNQSAINSLLNLSLNSRNKFIVRNDERRLLVFICTIIANILDTMYSYIFPQKEITLDLNKKTNNKQNRQNILIIGKILQFKQATMLQFLLAIYQKIKNYNQKQSIDLIIAIEQKNQSIIKLFSDVGG